jgi:hypothetical protein
MPPDGPQFGQHAQYLGGAIQPCGERREASRRDTDENDMQEFYLMTDDLEAEIATLKKSSIACEAKSESDGARSHASRCPAAERLGSASPSIQDPSSAPTP